MANPFLVLGGIAVGIITAAFGVLAVPGWVASAQDAAASNDISQLSAAQSANLSETGRYAGSLAALLNGSVKVAPSGGVRTYTAADPTGKHHLMVTRSATGTYFARTSDRTKIGEGKTLEEAVSASGATVTGPATARATERGVRLPSVADGLADLAYTNYHPNPEARGNGQNGWYRWTGSGNTVTDSLVAASWTHGGSAVRARWTSVVADTGDVAVKVGNILPTGSKVTVRFSLVANAPVTLSAARGWNNTSVYYPPHPVITASSHPRTFTPTPGVPIDVWVTAIVPEDPSPFRIGFDLKGHAAGLTIDMADADIYEGDYDPDRPWFSGSNAPEGLLVDWAGGANNSISRAYR